MVAGWVVSSVAVSSVTESSLPVSSWTVPAFAASSLTDGGSGSEPLSQAPRLRKRVAVKRVVRVRMGSVMMVVS